MKEGAGIGRKRWQEENVRVAVVCTVRDQVRGARACQRLHRLLVATSDGDDGADCCGDCEGPHGTLLLRYSVSAIDAALYGERMPC